MKLGNKIVKITKINPERFAIHLRFSDGTQDWVSLAHIFEKPKGLALEISRGNLFERCFLESGALAWPNGLELCPDAIRLQIEFQKKDPAA